MIENLKAVAEKEHRIHNLAGTFGDMELARAVRRLTHRFPTGQCKPRGIFSGLELRGSIALKIERKQEIAYVAQAWPLTLTQRISSDSRELGIRLVDLHSFFVPGPRRYRAIIVTKDDAVLSEEVEQSISTSEMRLDNV